MSADSESAALIRQRFKMYYHPVPDHFAHRFRQPIRTAPTRTRRAKPIELLERRIMMSGGYLPAEAFF